MTKYTEVKSKFIKEKIKKATWKSREYIDNLIFLEDIITGKQRMTWMGSFRWNGLKESLNKEFTAIYKELKPKEYKKLIADEKKEDKKEKRQEKQWEKEERDAEIKDRKDWVRSGGKL